MQIVRDMSSESANKCSVEWMELMMQLVREGKYCKVQFALFRAEFTHAEVHYVNLAAERARIWRHTHDRRARPARREAGAILAHKPIIRGHLFVLLAPKVGLAFPLRND